MTSRERAVDINAVCEEVIALAIADDQNAFRAQRSLELATWLDLTLTLNCLVKLDYQDDFLKPIELFEQIEFPLKSLLHSESEG